MGARKAAAAALAAAIAVSAAGCARIGPADPKDGWSTTASMSSTEYAIFLAEETAVLENVLMTRVASAASVVAGTYEAEAELANAEEAESKLASVVDEITVTMPSREQESDRRNALDLAQDALDSVRKYEEALRGGDMEEVEARAEEMRSRMIASSGAANVPYE